MWFCGLKKEGPMNLKSFSLVISLFLMCASAVYADSFCGSLTDVRRPLVGRESPSLSSRLALVLYNYEEEDNRNTCSS